MASNDRITLRIMYVAERAMGGEQNYLIIEFMKNDDR